MGSKQRPVAVAYQTVEHQIQFAHLSHVDPSGLSPSVDNRLRDIEDLVLDL